MRVDVKVQPWGHEDARSIEQWLRCEGNLFGVGFGGGREKHGLAVVSGGASIVDWDVVGHDKTTEVEELVEMACAGKGTMTTTTLVCLAIWDMVLMVLGVSH
ncbi:hypothetical protein FCV25MIE_14291 [Fagus crenata]